MSVGAYMVIRRTCQFFDCNLKLGLLRSRRDSWQCGTSRAGTDADDVSLAGVLQMQLVAQYVVKKKCLPFLGDNTRFFSVGTPPGVKSADSVFVNPSAHSDMLLCRLLETINNSNLLHEAADFVLLFTSRVTRLRPG